MSETQQGLAGLLEEWRKQHNRAWALTGVKQSYKERADELHPFVERLKGLEQQMKHEEKNEYYDAMTPSGMRTFLDQDCMETCVKCQLHALIYGEQPAGDTHG